MVQPSSESGIWGRIAVEGIRRAVPWLVCVFASSVYGQTPEPRIPHRNPIPEGGVLADHLAQTEVSAETWPTEVLNSTAGGVLNKIGAVVGGADPATIDALVSDSYHGGTLRPDRLEPVWEGDGLRILRGPTPAGTVSQPAGLKASLKALARPFDGKTFKTKFKIDRVELLPDGMATTQAIYLAMGTGPGGVVQQNALWQVSWDVSAGVEHPILTGITAAGIEEVSRSAMLFSDCTEAALGAIPRFEFLRRSIDHWWGRLDGAMGLSLYGDYGLAIGDIDNDDLEDIYVCMPGGLTNMLLKHNPDGTLTDISDTSGVNLYNDTGSALILDVDNDGRQDLILGTQSHVAVMRGLGNGRFEDAGAIILGSPLSLSAADYDGDGLVDLYVCFYSNARSEGTAEAVYDSNRGKANRLWRNEGNLVFRDVTDETGMNQNNERYSFAAVWEDYDNDGDPDLYVANDFGRNNLYRNDKGKFTDVAPEAGVEDMAAGMGVAWADYDHDGDFDLYVSNMFSSAGGRVSFQRKFEKMVGGERVDNYGYFARGNTLFRNRGDGTFEDVSLEAGVTMGRWAWGAGFLDFNNDGWDDLFVPNGYITNDDSRDL
jgi:hypothetical protein